MGWDVVLEEHNRALRIDAGREQHRYEIERSSVEVYRLVVDRDRMQVGNIFISVIAGTLAFIVLEILRVPFAAALAVWVAIADLIPGVGAMLGAVVCVIVALFSSVADGIAVAVYFIVYQRIENYLILPRVMGKAIDLSAPTVIIALLIGSSLAGLEGALIALPIVAAIKVVIRELRPGPGVDPLAASPPVESDDA